MGLINVLETTKTLGILKISYNNLFSIHYHSAYAFFTKTSQKVSYTIFSLRTHSIPKDSFVIFIDLWPSLNPVTARIASMFSGTTSDSWCIACK